LGLLLVAPPVALVGWLILWPIVSAIRRTLFQPDGAGGTRFTVESYQTFFADPYSLGNLGATLWTTAVCAVLLLLICLPIALYLRFATGRLAGYVQGLAIFPMFVPSVILSYAIIRVLGPNGTVDLLLNAAGLPKIRSPYLTPWGPVIGLVWDHIPLVVLILLSGLGRISNAAVEAARDVGAGRLAVLRHIILPRIGNSILVAMSFTVLASSRPSRSLRLGRPRRDDGPFMQRTFRDLNDPTGLTQASSPSASASLRALLRRSVARNRPGDAARGPDQRPGRTASPSPRVLTGDSFRSRGRLGRQRCLAYLR
jgi:ABC-type spermidine/putrescine transport system permease subunit I